MEPAKCKEHTVALTVEINKLTFTEECLVDDDFVKIHTGLPNAKVVKAVFELYPSLYHQMVNKSITISRVYVRVA